MSHEAIRPSSQSERIGNLDPNKSLDSRVNIGPGSNGYVAALGLLSGELYYWIVLDDKSVAMMPDFAVFAGESTEEMEEE